jgi:ribosomal protein S27AE
VWELERQFGEDSPAYKRGLLATVRKLLDRPVSPPYVAHRVPFPDAGRLNDGEKYLLHRWLLKEEKRYNLVYAYPVWLVVRAAEGDTDGWRVVEDNLCPRCGRVVRAEHLTGDDDRSHRWCRELWEETGWQPGKPACPQERGGL